MVDDAHILTFKDLQDHLISTFKNSDSVNDIQQAISILSMANLTSEEILTLLINVNENNKLTQDEKRLFAKSILELNNGPNSDNNPKIYIEAINKAKDLILYESIVEHYINREKITINDLIKFIDEVIQDLNSLKKLVDKVFELNPTPNQICNLISAIKRSMHERNLVYIPILERILDQVDLEKFSVKNLLKLMDIFEYSQGHIGSFVDVLINKNISPKDLAKVLEISILSHSNKLSIGQISNLLQKFINMPNKANSDLAKICYYLDLMKNPPTEIKEKMNTLRNQLFAINDFTLLDLTKLIKLLEVEYTPTLEFLLDKFITHPEFTPKKISNFISKTEDFHYLPHQVKNRLLKTLAEHPNTSRNDLHQLLLTIYDEIILDDPNVSSGIAKALYRYAQYSVLNGKSQPLPVYEYPLSIDPLEFLIVIKRILNGSTNLTWGAEKGPILEASSVFPNVPQASVETLPARAEEAMSNLTRAWLN